MRTIKQYLEAAKARKENGEAGFSLVELIVVVVILGILAAVAIPIFNNIQTQARQSALESITGNGAAQVAADIAQNVSATDIEDNLQTLADQSVDQVDGLSLSVTGADQIGTYCVTGEGTGLEDALAGPGCA